MSDSPENLNSGVQDQAPNEWDRLRYLDAEGETNTNRATGEVRTFEETDIYPRLVKENGKKETKKEYDERLRWMHEKTAEYEAKQAENEYLGSEFGQIETRARENYDRLKAKIEEDVREGKVSEERAKKYLEKKLQEIDQISANARQDYEDSQTVGPAEEQEAYDAWLQKHDEENRANLEKRQTTEENKSTPEEQNEKESEKDESTPEEQNEKESEEDKAAAEEKAKQRKEKLEAIKEMEGKLAKARTELAERYAKNRSIIPGYRDKNDFLEKSNNFEDNLDNLLRAKADLVWDDEQERIGAELQKELDALNPEDGDFEEKKKALIEKYDKEYKKSRDKLKADFTEDFINEQKKLEEETIDRLDNGNLIRKAVHTLRSNKKVKLLLAGAAAAGFAAAVVASGGLAGVGLSYSAAALKAGWVAGAVKGAGMGLLTSRQDSKISAVRGYASMNEEEIRSQLSKILGEAEQGNNTNWLGFNGEGENGQDDTESKTRSVASYILDEYEKSNNADYAGNWKRTSKGMLIGGALGALASGLQISKTTMVEKPGDIQVDLSKVDIPEGHGAYDTFTQLGGNPKDLDQALAIMKKIDLQSGGQFVPGSNGETIGLGRAVGDFAHTYPGPISTWPKAAQTYIEAVAKEWAKEGLIDYTRDTIMEPVKQYTAFGLAQFLAGAAGGELAGGVHSTVKNTSPASGSEKIQPKQSESTSEAKVQKRTETIDATYDTAADGIEKQIAEREAAVTAARIEAEIAEREALEKERRAKHAKEEAIAAEKERDEFNKTTAEIEKQIAEREAAEIETKLANEAIAAEIEAKLAKKESTAEVESKRADEAMAIAIEKQIAAEDAAIDLEAKIAERDSAS